MKIKSLSYDEWSCITKKRFALEKLPEGYLSLLKIDEVTEPQIWDFRGERLTVCDKGMQWMSYLVPEQFFCLTAMMDESGLPRLWYADMIASAGLREDGVPYFEDLYLDLVLFYDGTLVEDDRDELEEAFAQGIISPEQRNLADAAARRLRETLLSDVETLRHITQTWYERIFHQAQ